MKKNTKKILSIMTVAGLSVSTLSSNIENLANAKEDITSIAELTNSADRLSTEVIENEAGAVIRVSAHVNIQNVKTTYSVDNTKSQVVSFGDLKAGEVREIQVNLDENCNTAKVLPKTSVVSDKVEFSKEIRCHKIKGNVSYEYDNGLKPSQPTKPSKPKVPETPEKPSVDGLLPADEEVLQALQFILDDAHKGHKIEYKKVSVDKNVDLDVEYVDDDTLEEGKVVLKRAGSPTVVRTITREIYVDGVHIPKYTMLMDRIEIKQGVAKVYARGTKKVENVKPTEPTTPETPEQPGTPETPEKPGTPEVDPALEVGMPDGVKWSRTYLSKKLGLELGQLTGNYEIDGDLGVFKTEDELSDAYDRAADQWDKDWINKKITDEVYQKLPKGFTLEEVTLPDGSKGFKANFFGKDGKTNNGQEV